MVRFGEADMSAPLTLTLPMPPTLTNSGKGRSRHWRALEREKEAYWLLCLAEKQHKRIPPPPATPIHAATLRSTMYLGGHMDEDGAVSRHKWALDWLVTHKYLRTDRRTGLRWEAFPEQIVKRDGNYRLVLTITPL
jgi:hypothetical protein